MTVVRPMIMSPVVFRSLSDTPEITLYQSLPEPLSFPLQNDREYWWAADAHPDALDESGVGRGDLCRLLETALNLNAAGKIYDVTLTAENKLNITVDDNSSFSILFSYGTGEFPGYLFGCESVLSSSSGVATSPYPVYGRWVPSTAVITDSTDTGHGVGSVMRALDGTSQGLQYGETKPQRSMEFDHLAITEMLVDSASHRNAAFEQYWRECLAQRLPFRFYDDYTATTQGAYEVYRVLNADAPPYQRSNDASRRTRWQFRFDCLQVTSKQQDNTLTGHLASTHAVDPYLWALDGAQKITVSGWFRWPTTSGDITLWERTSGSGSELFKLRADTTGPTMVADIGSATATFVWTDAFDDYLWHHYVMVYDGTAAAADRCRLYIAGSDIGDPTITGTIQTAMPESTAPFGFTFNGSAVKCSSFAVWKTALTATQVSKIYNGGMPQNLMNYWTIPKPEHWWPCSTDGVDAAGNQDLATGSGFTFVTTDWPGKPGNLVDPEPDVYSLQFDNVTNASGGYVDISGTSMNSAFHGKTTLTVAFWHKTNSTNDAGFVIDSTGASSAYGLFTIRQNTSDVDFRMANSSGVLSVRNKTTYSRTNGTWYHVVIVYNAAEATNADKIKFYINGSQTTSTVTAAAESTIVGNAANNINSVWTIGVEKTPPSTFSDGFVDVQFGQLLIYSSALNLTEVQEIYNGGNTEDPTTLASYSNCMYYFKFDDAVATYPTLTEKKAGLTCTLTRMASSDLKADMP